MSQLTIGSERQTSRRRNFKMGKRLTTIQTIQYQIIIHTRNGLRNRNFHRTIHCTMCTLILQGSDRRQCIGNNSCHTVHCIPASSDFRYHNIISCIIATDKQYTVLSGYRRNSSNLRSRKVFQMISYPLLGPIKHYRIPDNLITAIIPTSFHIILCRSFP